MKVLTINIRKAVINSLKKNDYSLTEHSIKNIIDLNGILSSLDKNDVILIDSDTFEIGEFIEIIEKIKSKIKKAIILVLGEKASINWVAGSIKAGAYDYLIKPIDSEKLDLIIKKAIKDIRQKAPSTHNKKQFSEDEIIGTTQDMIKIFKTIGKVGDSNLPILIEGEMGSGKELIAQAIHKFSDRSEEPFVVVNCSSGTYSTLEKELLGEGKPIHSDYNYRTGKLEMANNGTLFLDEIGDMPIEMQLRLDRILKEQNENREEGFNVRIVASTSKDLEELIALDRFSDDFYHTLKVLEIYLPPLRERKDDLPYLIEYFIDKFNVELDKNIKGVSKNAMKKLVSHEWSGNVRELKNALKGSIAVCRGDTILIEDLPANVLETKISKRHGDTQDWVIADWIENEISILKDNSEKDYYDKVISRVERELIRQVLEITNSKKVETAELLGITRNTLRAKMNNYGLE